MPRNFAVAVPFLLLLALALPFCSGGGDSAAPDVRIVDDVPPVLDDVPSAPDIADVGATDEDLAAVPDVVDTLAADVPPPPPLWEELTAGGPTLHSLIGVSTHMQQSAGENVKRDFEFATYEALGGARIRQDYHWHRIEPADDDWHFEAVATQVEMAMASGVEILAMLAYGVDWAMPDGATNSIDPAAYADYAGAVAAEFCGEVTTFEIWNEPNLDRFWKPLPDAAHWAELQKAAYTAIKEACPEARVATAGFSSWDTHLEQRWWFFAEAWRHHPDLCDYFDVVALHPYTFGQMKSPEYDWVVGEHFNVEGQRWMVRILRDLLTDMGCPDRPLWFTEIGWPSYDLSEDEQARFLARSLLLASADGVETYFWYTFWDSDPRSQSWRPHEDHFGLFAWVGDDGTIRRAKPSYIALKAVNDLLGDARFARDLSPALELPNDVYALAFLAPNGEAETTVVALWDGRDMPDAGPDGSSGLGGPDTTHALTLPLPEGTAGWVRHAMDGTELDRGGADEILDLTLTPDVQYLVLVRVLER